MRIVTRKCQWNAKQRWMRINPKKTIELISLSIKGDRNSWTQKTQAHILRGPYWNENKRRKKNYKFWCEVFYGSQRFLWTCTLHTHTPTLIYTPMESLFVFYITKNQSLSRVCMCVCVRTKMKQKQNWKRIIICDITRASSTYWREIVQTAKL